MESYGPASRLQTVSDGNGNTATYRYLDNYPLVQQISFSHNGATRMTTVKQHDNLNRLIQISSAPSSSSFSSFAYVYNSANQRTRRTEADGSYWDYQYDFLGQVTSGKRRWADGSRVAGQQFEYTFDDIGNRTQTKAGGDQNGANLRFASYSPNLLNQYDSRTVPGALDVMGASFATNTVQVNGASVYRKGEYFRKELTADNTNSGPFWLPITVTAGSESKTGNEFLPGTPESFSHDADGNLTADGRWDYSWDAENRLVSMVSRATAPTGSERKVDFTYDWKGRRIGKRAWNNTAGTGNPVFDEKFVYDGWNLIAELNATNNGVITSYEWGSDLSGSLQGAGGIGGLLLICDPTSALCYAPAFDGNGNVMALTSMADGTTAAQYEYGPFGELIRATGPVAKAHPFRFSTKYQDDETDLLYYGYRYYNASTGRWLSRDPIDEPGSRFITRIQNRTPAGALLEYCFVDNRPTYTYDRLGLENPCGTDECKCLGCMVYAEARSQPAACQKAIADVIKNRAATRNINICDIVAERDGGEFNGYKTTRYKLCCEDKCRNIPGGAQNKDARDTAFKNSECGVASGSHAPNANYFNNAGQTPDWIKRKLKDGKASEVSVPGCSVFQFYYVQP